ncbi:MAG: hypothetical protein GX811_09790 [Lentisphaerae bacterium]|jgi:hypothetical protein|nr:hypothetical protein [Lentisphaerota bacterium]
MNRKKIFALNNILKKDLFRGVRFTLPESSFFKSQSSSVGRSSLCIDGNRQILPRNGGSRLRKKKFVLHIL